MPNQKKRVIPFSGVQGSTFIDQTIWDNGRVDPPVTSRSDNRSYYRALDGIQFTESISHPSWRKRRPGVFQGNEGGPFFTYKKYGMTTAGETPLAVPVTLAGRGRVGSDRYRYGTYIGPMLPLEPSQMGYPPPLVYSDSSSLDKFGTKAIALVSPSNPTADLSVFLKELLTEGLPKMIGSTLTGLEGTLKNIGRKPGKEYLNVEFGWKPMISDLRKLASAIIHANSVIEQYYRGSGSMVRRRYAPPPVTKTETFVWKTNVSPWIGPSVGTIIDSATVNKGTVYCQETTVTKQWFSGAFTYYVPPDETIRGELARMVIMARKLLGLSLTPDELWNMAPWSWAVDWFFNVGQVLHNWSNWAIDNQVLLYGYVMEQKFVRRHYTFSGPTGFKPAAARPSDVVLTLEVKQRRKATPYGFGVVEQNLSARQKAIAAAIATTRGK